MQISEIFYSIQGEGNSFGKPMVFVRTAACNLRCNFCDSTYASRSQGAEWSIFEIFREVSQQTSYISKKYVCKDVCITGGEPTIQADFGDLIYRFLDAGYKIEVETNGSIRPPAFCLSLANKIKWNVSPKLSNSGNQLNRSINKDLLSLFNMTPEHIFKFVIGNESDFKEAESLIMDLDLKNVYMMPEGVKDVDLKKTALWLIDRCKETGFYFSSRLHIWLWEGKRGV